MSKKIRAGGDSTELQHLLDKYCTEIKLPTFPPTRIQSSASLHGDRANQAAATWTQQDTENALKDLSYDVHLGVKVYHTDPIHRIYTACRSSNKLFIDHEFCVADGSEVTIREDKICTPGIITSQNADDFATSGDPKRVARIGHFTSKARRSNNASTSEWTWKRGSLMPGKKLFSSPPKAQNVVQGKVGNCGFCSGFASLAAHFPDIITNALQCGTVENSIAESVGALSVRIYPGGRERFMLLDDYLLCLANSSTSPALHSLDENDLWIRVLEKVFVKLQSSYASLDGYYKYNSLYRHPARALQLISNAPIALELRYTVKLVNEVYSALLSTEENYVRVAHGRKAVEGLFRGHGYSLLWVGEIAGIRMVLLRNPHGNNSFTGEFGRGGDSWSSEDAISVDNELKNSLINPSLDTLRSLLGSTGGGNDDGIFLMRFAIFVECFPITTVVGPIHANGEPKGFVVKDSLYTLPIEKLKAAESLFKVAER